MSYAQINYPQSLGTGSSVDTIADVGCFLTAFSNLLERLGTAIDPPTLNNYFISHEAYLPDGPNRDNLGWGSVSAYDGSITVTNIGDAGWPSTNEAIVKFVYKSHRTGNEITHFCLVLDHNAGTIIDSYDGREKHTPYGQPVGWATYERHALQVIASPPPAEASAFTIENVAACTQQLTKDSHLWDMNQRSWPSLVNNPVSSISNGELFTTSRIAHHVLGGSYYVPDGHDSQGYNVIDCQTYTAPVPPTPSTPPSGPLMPSGNPENTYTVIKTVPGYMTATNAGNHTNQVNEIDANDYFVYNVHPLNADLINITSKLGVPGTWINKADNVIPAPVVMPEPVLATPPPVVVPVEVAPEPTPPEWQQSFKAFDKPIHFVATRDLSVADLSGKQATVPLKQYSGDKGGVVSAFGIVNKDGIDYYRLKTNNDPSFSYWYCIPKMDEATHTPNLLAMPTKPGVPVGKLTIARDTVQLAKTRIEKELPKFLDDILPKWIHKNKK